MKLTVFMILILSSMQIAIANDQKNEDIQTLIDLMNTDSMIDSMYVEMEKMVQNLSVEMGVKESEKPIFDKYYKRMITLMREEMGWKQMEPMMIEIYSNVFTTKEIKDMIAFYSTESGKSVVKKMPEIMQQSMTLSQDIYKGMIPKLQKVTQELQQELNSKRANK